jgi:hypothetical protein
MDIEKIKSGRMKPVFVRVLEWVMLGTLTVLFLAIVAVNLFGLSNQAAMLFSFLVMIEVGLLSVFYGIEGIKYGIIWLTFPTPSGPKRWGFNGAGAFIVGAAYVIMGLAFMVIAIAFAYLNGSSQ